VGGVGPFDFSGQGLGYGLISLFQKVGGEKCTIPAWSGSDRELRLAEKGLADGKGGYGDLVIELRIILLEKPDEKVTDLMRHMREGLYL